jgi:CBS domain-containing protein
MICPNCGHDNLPGSEACSSCGQDLSQLDLPVARDRVERSLMEDTVGRLCAVKPICVKPDATLHDALQTMIGGGVGALLIVSDANLVVGILTERDLLTKVAGFHSDLDHLRVQQFMKPDPEVLAASDTLAFALHKMDIGGYRHLPVVRDGQPVGVISVRDMLRHIAKLCKDF